MTFDILIQKTFLVEDPMSFPSNVIYKNIFSDT